MNPEITEIIKQTNIILSDFTEQYHYLMPQRDLQLFTHFLPAGYARLTISSVPEEYKKGLVIAKTCLGMLITLADDFADNPKLFNRIMVLELSKIPFHEDLINDKQLTANEKSYIDLAKRIAQTCLKYLKTFPSYNNLLPIIMFDWQQIYHCNHYSSLLTQFPSMATLREFRSFAPYNMGMILAGMFDILASPSFNLDELGSSREFFYLAQRFGNICNTLSTLQREISEKDITNEVILMGIEDKTIHQGNLHDSLSSELIQKVNHHIKFLEQECEEILFQQRKIAKRISSFCADDYLEGLQEFKLLHQSMTGII